MKITGEAVLLRIFVGETDRTDGKLTYKKIVEILRENDVAGATVFRGILGYGASSRIHEAGILSLSSDLPVVIEVVDKKERIDKVLPLLDNIIKSGLITMEKVNVIKYTAEG
ncbi:DUF190 domain-containing protein [Hydrogenothermus marinus]|uniref:Uncharacterized protein n=1 Tax=Hydrogenothermus marinus TaxID=133270 RepID=A0A3M0BJW4_9AQUI|nr:DUF190 domain-containing protein [Hydrogenothermus marinus]RMA97733.1 hypothetical protein CLV39_0357 [Hydrogenothermus marinus]